MRKNNAKIKSGGAYFDYSLLFITIFMLCFGMIMLYSASSYEASMELGSSTFYLKKQMFSAVVGIALMIMFIKTGYRWLKRPIIAGTAYFGSIISVIMVLSPLGYSANGARRWLNLGVATLQPSEVTKLGLIIFMAYYINRNSKKLKNFWYFFASMTYIGIAAALIAVITSDLSSAVIILAIGVIMLFVASPKIRYFIIGGVACIGLLAAALIAKPYRMERIRVWRNPEKYSSQGGYQVLQALYSLGSGGLFGKGLGKGIQKLGYVPEAQNDMIFTVICEELGVIGGIAVILLFVFMIWRFMIISNNAPDLFGSMLVVGIMAHIAVQTVMNIAVVTNSMPNTGVTLPFMSYGGSSIMLLLAEIGIVLSVSKRIRFE